MKKLYLIGDSIRMGYSPFVRAALDGIAEVFEPYENCRFAAYTYYALGDWEHNMRIGSDLDAVHWNVGLHDCIHFCSDGIMTQPDVYASYVKRIYERLRFLYPAAEQIFATSTPVDENGYSIWLSRKNCEIDTLNKAAVDTLSSLDVTVNDLHGIARPEYRSDMTHYNTPAGREAFTKAVLKSVCPALGIDFNSLRMPDFSDEGVVQWSKEQILK